jgi:hypothetical protein
MPVHRCARRQDNNHNKENKRQSAAEPKPRLRKISEKPHQSSCDDLTTWDAYVRQAPELFWF